MRTTYIYWFAHYKLAGPCVRYRGKYFLDQLKMQYNIQSSFVYPGYHYQNILHFIQVYFSALLFRRKDSVIVHSSPIIEHQRPKQKRNAVLTIGWIGFYNAHRENLMKIFLPALLQIDIPINFMLLGVTRSIHIQELHEALKGKENILIDIPEQVDWLDEDSVYAKVAGFDVGIAPLIDNPYNRAKSAFKLKQYLSCGIPVLGSRVGENKTVIQNGLNGFFCDTPEDYLKMILFFAHLQEEKYSEYCINAKLSSASFSMNKYCDSFMEFCQTLSV